MKFITTIWKLVIFPPPEGLRLGYDGPVDHQSHNTPQDSMN